MRFFFQVQPSLEIRIGDKCNMSAQMLHESRSIISEKYVRYGLQFLVAEKKERRGDDTILLPRFVAIYCPLKNSPFVEISFHGSLQKLEIVCQFRFSSKMITICALFLFLFYGRKVLGITLFFSSSLPDAN